MTRLRALGALVFSAISAAMLGLAAGAIWMLPTVYMRLRLPWLAWPAGAALGFAVARWSAPRTGAPLLAALATLLASAYVSVLTVAATLAGNMDMGLVESMRAAGTAMLAVLAWLSLSPGQLVWFVTGAALSAWIARRTRLH